MSTILAIDPGNFQSAYVLWNGKKIIHHDICDNDHLLSFMKVNRLNIDLVLIEMIACYGMAVGKEVFDTCKMVGKLEFLCKEIIEKPYELVYRKDVKIHHCHSMKANDSNIRQALIDKYGSPGTKKNKGLTYGLSKDKWQAFAIATMYTEQQELNNSIAV